jgi:hypothetical protein
MMLEGSNSSSAIGWVREDLDQCLEKVRENLESFAEDTSQREPLMAVQEELEQLNLTFLTMEQRGAGILTDEMIAVGGHMLHNGNPNCTESLNALTDAVIVLPSYLDRLQAGHEDLPILLLPTLNELRATYDEKLLSEGTLFAPELDVMIPELSGSEADAVASSDFATFARRIRSQYQGALLGWLKEQSRDALIEPMQAVCRTLYIRLGRNELRRLWWIAELAMQGLRDGAIDNDLPLRRLFARLDMTLKSMTEGGEDGPASDTITALSRALLFYAAQARQGSKATDLLRERFLLEELIPDQPSSDPSEALPASLPIIGPGGLEAGGGSTAVGATGGGPPGARRGVGGTAKTGIFGVEGEGYKFVYVFDRSYSMGGSGRSPLSAAKAELIASIKSLDKVHQFQIIFYNEQPKRFMQQEFPNKLFFANDQNKRLAEGFIRGITAQGGTQHEDALLLAIGLQPDVVFFLTDADKPILWPGQLLNIKRRATGIVINAIEFGYGPPSDTENFLKQLARDNGGKHGYLDVTRLRRD